MSCHVCQDYNPGHGQRGAFVSLAGDGELLPPDTLLVHRHAAYRPPAPHKVWRVATNCHRYATGDG